MSARGLKFCALSSSLAGFLFGFDTVVISGAEQTIQHLWGLSAAAQGFAIGAALYGTVLGAVTGGLPTDRFGRKPTLAAIGCLYLVGALWSALATGPAGFIAARLLGGIGIGFSTVAVPLYIAEITPPQARGRYVGLFQLHVVIGILIAYVSNALLSPLGANAWRYMLGVAAIPALIYTVLVTLLPESPRWLLTFHDAERSARRVLEQIGPATQDGGIDDEIARIRAAALRERARGAFWTRRLAGPIGLAVLLAFFNQMSGINVVLYYAPRIFHSAGLGAQVALLTSVGIGVVNLLFTLLGLSLIDRLGRRALLYLGSFGYIVSLAAISWAFFAGHADAVPIFVFLFVAAHAIGQGAVIWVYIAEVFPNRHRAEGQALGTTTHWVFAALVTTLFPKLASELAPGAIFLFFTFMMCLQLLWVMLRMVETKGRPLEQIE